MTIIGTFQSPRWGKVIAHREAYPGGAAAVLLLCEDGEPLAKLSVNMYRPVCSHDSRDLPPGCFYMKDWAENAEIAVEAVESGLFKARDDLPSAASGFVWADVYEIVASGSAAS
jgi:hypothetical protein